MSTNQYIKDSITENFKEFTEKGKLRKTLKFGIYYWLLWYKEILKLNNYVICNI